MRWNARDELTHIVESLENGEFEMNVPSDIIERIYAQQEGHVFTMDDLVSGHNPGLWMHLCHMDDGQHVREDGCLFVADQVRLSFKWVRPE
jgi:hypothetical protein